MKTEDLTKLKDALTQIDGIYLFLEEVQISVTTSLEDAEDSEDSNADEIDKLYKLYTEQSAIRGQNCRAALQAEKIPAGVRSGEFV